MAFGRAIRLCLWAPVVAALSEEEFSRGDLSMGSEKLKQGKLMRQEMRVHSFATEMEDVAATEFASQELESSEGPAEDVREEDQEDGDDDAPPSGRRGGKEGVSYQGGDDSGSSGSRSGRSKTTEDRRGGKVAGSNSSSTGSRKSPKDCAQVVSLSGDSSIKDVHPLALGIYHMIRNVSDPPIYINSNRQFYMYYWQETRMWRVGKHYTNISAALSSNPRTQALCPDEVETWYAYTGAPSSSEKWTTKYQLQVAKEECPYMIRVTGAENEQPTFMGVYTMQLQVQDKHSTYKSPTGKYIRYCAELQAWRMGSDVETCSAGVASNATIKALCPTDTPHWAVLIAGTWQPWEVNLEAVAPARRTKDDEMKHDDSGKESDLGVPIVVRKNGDAADLPVSGSDSRESDSEKGGKKGGRGGRKGRDGSSTGDDDDENESKGRDGRNSGGSDGSTGGRNGRRNGDRNGTDMPGRAKDGDVHPHDEGTTTVAVDAHPNKDNYTTGAVNSVDCPVGGVELTADQCKTAASDLGMEYEGSASHPELPHGCIKSLIIGGPESDNRVKFNSFSWGEPSKNWEKLCKRSHKGTYQTISIIPDTTTATPDIATNSSEDSATSEEGVYLTKKSKASGVVIAIVLILMCIITALVVKHRRAAAAAKAAEEKDPLAAAPETYPNQGDYVLVISLNRKGYVSAPPDELWRYIVTFEDDNTVSDLLPYEDIMLVDLGAAEPAQ